MINRLTILLVNIPAIMLSVFIIVTFLFGWQARKFEIDASADTLLTQGNDHYIQTQLVNQKFNPDEFLLLVYQPLEHALFSQQTYEDLRYLADSAQKLERVKSVQSILTVPLLAESTAGQSVDLDLSSLAFDGEKYTNEQFSEILSGHPLYEDLLINEAQTSTALQISFHDDPELTQINNQIIDIQSQLLNGDLTDEQQATLERLKDEAEPLRKALDRQRNEEISYLRETTSELGERAEVYLGGAHALGFQLEKIVSSDLLIFGIAVSVMICVVLFTVFRHLRWVIIPVLCCACSVLITMGLLALFDLKATVVSANFIALQLILTLAIVVHLIVQYRQYSHESLDNEANSVSQRVAKTLQSKAAPCFYAGITTSVGFSSLLLSGIQPVISFGYMMILAMAVSIITSLILFPSMMAMLPNGTESKRHAITGKLVEILVSMVVKHPRMILVLSGTLFLVVMLGAFRLNVENSFLNYFDRDTQVYRELHYIDQEFGGSTPLDIVYRLQEPTEDDLILTAESIQKLEEIQMLVKSQPGMGKVMSIVNFTETAREMNGNLPLTEYELSSIYYLMEESFREELLGSFLSPETGEIRISARVKDSTPGLNRREIVSVLSQSVQDTLPAESNVRLTNLFVLYQDVLQKLMGSQIYTIGLVFSVLGLMFIVIFRSFALAAIALVPNVLSTGSILGVMGWFKIPLDLMTITIAAIAMGIAVDNTIHYVHRYREEISRGSRDSLKATEKVHESVGFAIIYTTLIITAGFSMLSLSDFVPSVYFGLLTGVAMVIAFICNLTLLPVLLNRYATGRQ